MLRRRVRRSFLFAAVGFIALGATGLAHQDYAAYGETALAHYGYIAFFMAQGLLYAAAWFTTKTPSPYRSNWAVGASLVTLAWAGYRLWLHHADVLDARVPLVGLVIAAAGLYVFLPGGAPPKPESADTAKDIPVLIPTKPRELEPAPQQFSPRMAPSAPTAVAPSIATLRGASPQIDPNAPWDPLQFIRTPETLQKLR